MRLALFPRAIRGVRVESVCLRLSWLHWVRIIEERGEPVFGTGVHHATSDFLYLMMIARSVIWANLVNVADREDHYKRRHQLRVVVNIDEYCVSRPHRLHVPNPHNIVKYVEDLQQKKEEKNR